MWHVLVERCRWWTRSRVDLHESVVDDAVEVQTHDCDVVKECVCDVFAFVSVSRLLKLFMFRVHVDEVPREAVTERAEEANACHEIRGFVVEDVTEVEICVGCVWD